MNFLKNIFPQVRHDSNKGNNTFEIASTNRVSVPITFIEDEPTTPIAAVEQTPAVEKVETAFESGVEKNRELIEKSFLRVFSKESNEDVRIESQKDHGKIKKVGTLLRNALLFDGGALDLLRKLFIQEHGNDDNLKESEVDAYVKRFCLSNLNNIACESVDTKLAIEKVCNKGVEQTVIEPEKVDEKLEKEINDVWDRIVEIAELLGNENGADRDSGLFIDEAKAFFNEEVKKIETLSIEVNGRIKSDGTISEYNENVLNFFISHLEKITQLQEEYEKNKEQFRKPEIAEDSTVTMKKDVRTKKEKDEGRLNYRLERMAYALEVWKSSIEKLNAEKGDKLESLSYYTKKVASPKKDGIVGEYLERLNAEVEKTEKIIKEIWKVKKNEFTKIAKIENNKDKGIELHEIAPWVAEFEKAISKIKIMTMAEALAKYEASQKLEASTGDYSKVLNGFLQAHEHDSHDKFADIEGISLDNARKAVAKINAADCDFDLVVINGNTYKFKKEKASISAVDVAVENKADKKEAERKEIFDATLEMTQNFRDHLAEAFGQDEGWKKYRKEHQDNILKGEVVAFLDELLVQEKIVADEEKENFIENVLVELGKV